MTQTSVNQSSEDISLWLHYNEVYKNVSLHITNAETLDK